MPHSSGSTTASSMFVGLSRCVFSNVASFTIYSRALKSPAMILMCFSGLDVFVHLLDAHVRVSRAVEVHAGQSDLALIALDCCGDHR